MMAALPDWNGAIRTAQQSESVESIVLLLDGSEQSRAALPVAQKLSEVYSATLHVTYIGEKHLDHQTAAAELGFNAQGAHGVVFERDDGDPLNLVTHLSGHLPRPLLVMSTEIGAPIGKQHFGSLTESVVASRPARTVLLTPEVGNKPWSIRRILLAHDGTPISDAATGPAADLAQRTRGEVIALHVAARGEARPQEPGSIPAPLYVDQPQHEWPAWVEEFMNRLLAAGAPESRVQFKLTVTGGQAGSEVAQAARERNIDLVVMAWHGHWDHASCATRVVVRTAGCPVMLVYSAD